MMNVRSIVMARTYRRGFTLIELMVAMVVSSIVVLGIFAFSSIQQSTAGIHERNVRTQQALEGAMWTVGQDVRAAGFGFARLCTELRIYADSENDVINPGAKLDVTKVYLDKVTKQPYWVLRDGFQPHWESGTGFTMDGGTKSSAGVNSAADSFDVMLAERGYTATAGAFTLEKKLEDYGSGYIELKSSTTMLDSSNGAHVSQVRQLFPPGSFVLVARPAGANEMSFKAEVQSQCVVLQVTDEVIAGGVGGTWRLPVGGTSGFNKGLQGTKPLINANDHNALVGAVPGNCGAASVKCDDWEPTNDMAVSAVVVPLGALRWSRYEIDYTVSSLPYLVRYDIIGYQSGVDPTIAVSNDYPTCKGTCPLPQLHLPGSNVSPVAIAVGPMIEDMQVAVGCDGYTALGAASANVGIPPPEAGFEERGPQSGPLAMQANLTVDENAPNDERGRDEWLGNAIDEQWGPDCVYYGTGEYNRGGWVAKEGNVPPPGFRMSPQVIRITLLGSAEQAPSAGGTATDMLMAIEDRPITKSLVGAREHLTITERFAPRNLRWRDPNCRY